MTDLDSSKFPGLDFITVVILKNCETQYSYIPLLPLPLSLLLPLLLLLLLLLLLRHFFLLSINLQKIHVFKISVTTRKISPTI